MAPAQQSAWLPDGRWRLTLPYVDDRELLMDLLRHAGQVEVLGPAQLARPTPSGCATQPPP